MRVLVALLICVVISSPPSVLCSNFLCEREIDAGKEKRLELLHTVDENRCSTVDYREAIDRIIERLSVFNDEFRDSITHLTDRVNTLERFVLRLQEEVSLLRRTTEQRDSNASSSQTTNMQLRGVDVSVNSPITITIHSGQH